MKSIVRSLFFQVVAAALIGILLGIYSPHSAQALKPLGDGFVRLIKMVFAPVIALTVTLGVARMESMKELGKVGVLSLIYFEVASTFALVLGLIMVHVLQPGAGMNIDPASLDTTAIASYAAAKQMGWEDFLLNIIPTSIVDSFARNEVLQIIFFAILLGVALSALGRKAKPLVDGLETLTEALFSCA
jgi:aerobic C4-dicarboxylate transport protein